MPDDKNIYLLFIYLFIYEVLKQVIINLDSILVASNYRKICEHRLGRNLDWNCGDVFQGVMLLMAWTE